MGLGNNEATEAGTTGKKLGRLKQNDSCSKISKFSFQRLVQKIVLNTQKAMELTSAS